MARDRFMFFDNFKEIANKLPDDIRLKFYDALMDYVFNEKEPDDVVISALLTAIKPSLDKEEKRGGNHNPNGSNQYKEVKSGQSEVKKNQKEVKSGQSGQSFLETETGNKKQETETEREVIFSSDEPKKPYAFEGKVIRLVQKDFDEWKKAYPDLNIYAELLQRDRWLQEQTDDIKKKWFISTPQYFIKQNALRKAQNSEIAEQYGQQKASNDDGCWF